MQLCTQAPQRRLCHVLVVEDNPDGRESLRLLLEQLGCRVDVAVDGVEGVRKALELHPGLVLIDIGLPRLDGFQVAVRVRRALDGNILLVAYTAYDQDEARDRVSKAGFDGHVVKPAALSELTPWLDRARAMKENS